MSTTALDPNRLEHVRAGNGKTVARCPACAEAGADESGEHLFIDERGRFGCVKFPGPAGAEHRRRIFALVGMTERAALPPPRATLPARTWPAPEAAAAACTPAGYALAAVYRYQNGATARYETPTDKTFRQFHPEGDAWAAGAPSDPWALYGVEALPAEGAVWIVEGEKAHAAAESIGLPVVTSAGGSRAAAKSDWLPLAGREVVIIPDNDPPGEKYAADVAGILAKLEPPARVRVCRLPGLIEGGDIADFLDERDAADPATLRAEVEAIAAKVEAAGTAGLVSLVELAEQPIDRTQTLIGADDCRYLERGAVLLLAAPAGVGKSHLATQGAVCWACGRPAFGLMPANGPLRVLKVQAEDPPNDARQMAANMIVGLDLGPNQRALVHANTRQAWLPGVTGDTFLTRVHALLTAWPADVVFIDPLAGFASGDLVRPEVVQTFCRAGLGAMAVAHRCALFVCHHVPKPNAQRDASRMGAYDHQYSGAGSADLVANWPRAVLTLQPLARGEFILRAAKRRPPWVNEHGGQAWEIGLRHTDGGTWETFATDPETARTGRPPAPDPDTYRAAVLGLVADSGPMPKTALSNRVRAKITDSRDGARAVIELLVSDGSLATWRGAGRGGCAMIGLPSQAPKPKEAPE